MKDYTCDQCARSFSSYGSRYQHIKKKHRRPTITCPQCKLLSFTTADMYQHHFKCHPIKPLEKKHIVQETPPNSPIKDTFKDMLAISKTEPRQGLNWRLTDELMT